MLMIRQLLACCLPIQSIDAEASREYPGYKHMLNACTDTRCAGLLQALVDGWSQVGSAPHVHTASVSSPFLLWSVQCARVMTQKGTVRQSFVTTRVGCLSAGVSGALQRAARQADAGPAPAGGGLCRLLSLAAQPPHERAAGGQHRVLEGKAARRACAGAAYRPAIPSGRPELQR